jgi:hypothetical protein
MSAAGCSQGNKRREREPYRSEEWIPIAQIRDGDEAGLRFVVRLFSTYHVEHGLIDRGGYLFLVKPAEAKDVRLMLRANGATEKAVAVLD